MFEFNSMFELKKIIFIISVLAGVFNVSAKTKIACVGNSITEGFTNYPTSLQYMLGDAYEVGNFGNWGHTMVIADAEDQKSNPAYMAKQKFQDAQNFNPNIVIIKLGSNDSKTWFWTKYKDQFESDLRLMISTFQNLETNPRIILSRPIPAYNNGVYDINDKIIKEDITAILEKVADELGLTLVDAYGKMRLLPSLNTYYIWDGIHLNYRGSHQLALAMYEGVKGTPFYMKPGGVRINVSTEGPDLNEKIYLGEIHFGSIASYNKIEIKVESTPAVNTGQFEFYLDDEDVAFASIPVSEIDGDGIGSVIHDRAITDKHHLYVKRVNRQEVLQTVRVKEEFEPFAYEQNKVYYLINKATSLALTIDGSNLKMETPSLENTNQRFYFSQFSYGVHFIKSVIDRDKQLAIKGTSLAEYTGGAEDRAVMRYKAVGDGYFLFGLSDTRRFGLTASNQVKTNVVDSQATDMDMWKFVKAEDLNKAEVEKTESFTINIYAVDQNIIIQNKQESQSVIVLDVLGKLVFSDLLSPFSTCTIPVKKGIYLVKNQDNKIKSIKKILIN